MSRIDTEDGTAVSGAPPVWFRGEAHRAAKRFLLATHRTCTPEETLERIDPLLPLAGITRLADVTGLDRIGIPVVLAMRPNAPTLANSSGKGFTLAAATASAAMEGIEFHHAEELAEEPVEATWAQLDAAGLALPVEHLQLARNSLFDPHVAERWTLGWDIVEQRELAVPYDAVGLGRPAARIQGRLSFQIGSNGLASGNVFLEALCMGLAEVIERDAVALTKLRARDDYARLPKIDLDTVPYESVRELLERLDAVGLIVALFDCTVDTGVPAYSAVLLDARVPGTGKFIGYGAHLHPEVAMVRALTECVQSRVVYIAGSRDDLMWLEHARLHRPPAQLLVDTVREQGTIDAAAIEPRAAGTFEEDCRTLVDSVLAVGCEHVVVVDLTRPDFDLPVVRVFAPGLEGYRGFGWYEPGPRGRAAIAEAVA